MWFAWCLVRMMLDCSIIYIFLSLQCANFSSTTKQGSWHSFARSGRSAFFHSAIPNSNTHTKILLKFKLHHCFCFINLRLQEFLLSRQCLKLTYIQTLQNNLVVKLNHSECIMIIKQTSLSWRPKGGKGLCKYLSIPNFQNINRCSSKGNAEHQIKSVIKRFLK